MPAGLAPRTSKRIGTLRGGYQRGRPRRFHSRMIASSENHGIGDQRRAWCLLAPPAWPRWRRQDRVNRMPSVHRRLDACDTIAANWSKLDPANARGPTPQRPGLRQRLHGPAFRHALARPEQIEAADFPRHHHPTAPTTPAAPVRPGVTTPWIRNDPRHRAESGS